VRVVGVDTLVDLNANSLADEGIFAEQVIATRASERAIL